MSVKTMVTVPAGRPSSGDSSDDTRDSPRPDFGMAWRPAVVIVHDAPRSWSSDTVTIRPTAPPQRPSMTLDLDRLILDPGAHASAAQGTSVMEAVSVLAGEPWSNAPASTSPVIATYARSLGDWLGDDDRQGLKPYLARLVGTADPELEERRGFICADSAIRTFASLALAAAGLVEEAAKLAAVAPVDGDTLAAGKAAADAAEAGARVAASLSPWSTAESMRSAADSARAAARAAASLPQSPTAAARAAAKAAETAQGAARSAGRGSVEAAALELLDRLIAAATGTATGS